MQEGQVDVARGVWAEPWLEGGGARELALAVERAEAVESGTLGSRLSVGLYII